MGEMEFEQGKLVKAVKIAVQEMNQNAQEMRFQHLADDFMYAGMG